MEIRIEPLDTLFFRDGKPFEKGEDTWADGTIIPNPTVLYGALRTAFATENDITFKELADGDRLDKNEFKVQGIYYRIGSDNLLPLPLDLVEYDKKPNVKVAEKEAKRYEVKPLIVKKVDIISSKQGIKNHFLVSKEKGIQVEELENGLIVTTELARYLKGELEDTKAYKLSDYSKNEPKIGIGRENDTKVSEDGNLFRVDMKRGDGFQIGVTVDIDRKYNYGELIRLGGETKLVQLYSTRIPMRVIREQIDFSSGHFKVYFSTPATLKDGTPTALLTDLIGSEPTLITSTIGKSLHIGGFDMAKKEPKTMYKCIPAGSVFYYKADKDISLLNNEQGTSLSDELAEQGFGVCYFGTWNINK
jgi:CRISPR-associated protein Cmr3